jgi:hypothetical protein
MPFPFDVRVSPAVANVDPRNRTAMAEFQLNLMMSLPCPVVLGVNKPLQQGWRDRYRSSGGELQPKTGLGSIIFDSDVSNMIKHAACLTGLPALIGGAIYRWFDVDDSADLALG